MVDLTYELRLRPSSFVCALFLAARGSCDEHWAGQFGVPRWRAESVGFCLQMVSSCTLGALSASLVGLLPCGRGSWHMQRSGRACEVPVEPLHPSPYQFNAFAWSFHAGGFIVEYAMSRFAIFQGWAKRYVSARD